MKPVLAIQASPMEKTSGRKERERREGGGERMDGRTDGRMGKNEREESERKRASLPTGPLARHWSKTPLVKRKRKT